MIQGDVDLRTCPLQERRRAVFTQYYSITTVQSINIDPDMDPEYKIFPPTVMLNVAGEELSVHDGLGLIKYAVRNPL